MRWALVMAGVVAVLPAALIAVSVHRRIYLRWISGWVGGEPSNGDEAERGAERLLTEPLPGRVVGLVEPQFSGAGHVALVESGVRLTAWPRPEETTWGAFWPEVSGYVILPELGAVRIEISGHGYVHVETGSGAAQDQFAGVLRTKGVPLTGS